MKHKSKLNFLGKKSRIFIVFTVFLALMVLNGCSTAKVPFRKIENIPEEKSLIYAYSDDDLLSTIVINKDSYLPLNDGSYFSLFIDSGKPIHIYYENFFVKKHKGKLELDLIPEPGKTYYLKFNSRKKGFKFADHTVEVQIIQTKIGEKEIVDYDKKVTIGGMDIDPRSEVTASKDLVDKEKAVIHIYRSSSLVTAAIGSSKFGIDTPSGNYVLSFEAATSVRIATNPGPVRCMQPVIGDVAPHKLAPYVFTVKKGRTYYLNTTPLVPLQLQEPEAGKKSLKACPKMPEFLSWYYLDKIKQLFNRSKLIGMAWYYQDPKVKLSFKRLDQKGTTAGGAYANNLKGALTVGVISGLLEVGKNSIIDGSIKESNTDLQNCLNKEKINRLVSEHYLDKSKNVAGVSCFYFTDPLIKSANTVSIQKDLKDKHHTLPFNMEVILQDSRVDTAFILEVEKVELMRFYNGAAPTSNPKVNCRLKGYLVDTQTKEILAVVPANVNKTLDNGWDSSPEYSTVIQDLESTFSSAVKQIIEKIVAHDHIQE